MTTPVLSSSVRLSKVRELAFKHVEALLHAALAGTPIPQVCPGQYVQVNSLTKKTELNGELGMCFEVAGEDGCCTVRLQSGKTLRVKEANLIVLKEDEEDEHSEGSSEEEEEEEEENCMGGS